MAGIGGILPKLTIQDRIILHLADHAPGESEFEVPLELTQPGLAAAVGIEIKHVPQYVRPLAARDLVQERVAHIRGSRQRRKAYLLTSQGRSEAARLRGNILDIQVDVEVDGARRSMVLRDALKEHFRGAPLLGLLEMIADRGCLRASVGTETSTRPSPTAALQLPAVSLALEKATTLAKRYDWIAAADALGGALSLIAEDQRGAAGVVMEQLAYARYRSAFQADAPVEFRKRMERALEAYRDARGTYEAVGTWGRPRSLRCDAMIAYAGFWLASEMSERKRLLIELHERGRETLEAFEETEEHLEFGRTFNQLALDSGQLNLLWDGEVVRRILKESVEDGEKAVRSLVAARDPDELGRTYTMAAQILLSYSTIAGDFVERQRCQQAALDYWRKGHERSADAALLATHRSFAGDGSDESVAIARKEMQLAAATGDRYVAGRAARALAYQVFWNQYLTEDPVEKASLLEGAMQYAVEAKRQFDTLGVPAPASGSYGPESCVSEHSFYLARLEVDPTRKSALLEKALQAAQSELTRAQELEYEGLEAAIRFYLPDILLTLAQIGTRPEPKKRLLQEAQIHAQASVRFQERGWGRWNLAQAYTIAAEVTASLASLTEEPEARERALRAAISDMEAGLGIWLEEQKFDERLGDVAAYREIGDKQYEAGNLQLRLWDITQDPEDLRRGAQAFDAATKSYEKPQLPSRVAECHWRIAQVHDSLGNHRKAAHHFRLASANFEAAAAKILHLQELYKDHALYMKAWSEIEGARYHHARQEYGTAQEFYDRAANLHRFSRRWSSFAPNYSAWAALEKAEDLSRMERSEDAIQAFQEAARLFAETRNSLETAIPTLEDQDQKRMAEELANATDARSRYCLARIALEEARVLSKRGDYAGSSERYEDAANMLGETAGLLADERDRHEIKLIMTFSRAWQKMARAEADVSPEVYAEAASLFDEAKEMSPTDAGKTLALAHHHFCLALAAGAVSSGTRDPTQHAAVVHHLEMAGNSYEKMRLTGASLYAKASKLLFDAYVYLDRASQETDPTTKAKLFRMTERILHASADAFAQADQPGKEEEVLRLLGRVKEERDLAASLSDILRAPVVASATGSFPTPTPTREKPVGLDRFESADIRASLILDEHTVRAGQTFEVEIEMVNAGRGPAQLIKLENLGLDRFDLARVPDPYALEEDHLDMRGRRLEPLKTTEVKLLLRAREPGPFRLHPRILYLDENGRYRTHEPEPVEIEVREA